MENVFCKESINKLISKEEFIDDVYFFFECLKTTYGMYDYYGDSKFNEIKEELVNKIKLNYSFDRALSLLSNAFSFIKDGHFRVGFQTPKKLPVFNYSIKYDNINGINLIDCKKFYYDNDAEKFQLEEFVKSAFKYKNNDSLIFDLRYNGGGSTEYIYEFLIQMFDLKEIGYNLKYMQKYSELFKAYLQNENIDWIPDNPNEYIDEKSPLIPNKKKIYVLINEYTASAAEEAIAYFKNIENTIIVGNHSKGAFSCGNCIEIYLPKSHIPIYFGTGIVLYDGYVNIDEEGGFSADISYEEFTKYIYK